MEKKTQFSLWYFLFALFAVFTLHDLWVQVRTTEPLPYSEFQRRLKAGEVAEIAIADNTIQGSFKQALPDGRQKFVTTRVDPELARDLGQYDVKFTGVVESTLLRDILGWVLPAVIFVAIWLFAMRRFGGKQGFGGGFMNLGKSKAKVYVEANTGVSFADVAGVDEAKDELKEVVGFLKDPKSYGRLGGRVPKGVLLVGPPGTGKTLLAKAVAGEAGVPFFSISGSEFVEMFVGVGAARVRDLFEQARAKAPAIIFIDELDAMGRARGAFAMGGHDEKEQTLNQLLVELDGFDSSSGLVLLAATNRPEVLDAALLRAGRFDRQVLVDRPDKKGRIAILQVHMKKITLAPDLDAETVAALTPGFSGAELANLCNEAALVATRRNGSAVTVDDFTVAVERIVAGLEKKNRVLNEHERTVVAHHEMGHALVAMALPGTDPVHKISIIPRGVGALGYTIQRPTEDRFLMTRAELENKMAVLLGGRAAEQIIFGEVSTGAADDLQKVTSIARSIVMRFGMDDQLGNVAYDTERNTFLGQAAAAPAERSYSEETAREIDCAVRHIVARAFERSTAILSAHKDLLERSAADLLQRETFDEADLKALHTRVAA
ncbi:MAG TPA: ATP-dependent zinc metalloprotease FtsH [Rhodocyclaceae bacterium]|nr:ATP-dependent zinc metalloprotease FtsH [Rhodocyclaceae bacterium]HMY50779.1 ATP-dependent zinc metalloprotease FtsH [Rhodocyclaceae bacterium]HMZ77829.1 ATP-dependent zinc metalloprotease FtsH [Rhodocyclaceae bacterium]HNB66320.1 ATP-dependent zinc metalloprotease FtsH [Rhodocyclaceae bacterium]HNE17540.1 ATP-dependent zinc metalloprotease FtsH [Rhodocyclaceae bacterium]